MPEIPENVIVNGGIVVITFVLVTNFVLTFLDKIGKFDKYKGKNGNGYSCQFPSREYEVALREIRSLYEDGIRRGEREDQHLKLLEKISSSLEAQNHILSGMQQLYGQIVTHIWHDRQKA